MPARGAVCDGEEQAACALVHDPAHGGISPEEPRLECPEKYREFVFSGRTVITWAQDLRVPAPLAQADRGADAARLAKVPEARLAPNVLSRRSPAREALAFRAPVSLRVSEHNPGARDAFELASRFELLDVSDGIPPPEARSVFLLYLSRQTFTGPAGEALAREVRTARAYNGTDRRDDPRE